MDYEAQGVENWSYVIRWGHSREKWYTEVQTSKTGTLRDDSLQLQINNLSYKINHITTYIEYKKSNIKITCIKKFYVGSMTKLRRGSALVKWSEVMSLSHVLLFATPWTVAHQVPLFMGFSGQEYWSGLPFPSPGDLPDPGIEPRSPILQVLGYKYKH